MDYSTKAILKKCTTPVNEYSVLGSFDGINGFARCYWSDEIINFIQHLESFTKSIKRDHRNCLNWDVLLAILDSIMSTYMAIITTCDESDISRLSQDFISENLIKRDNIEYKQALPLLRSNTIPSKCQDNIGNFNGNNNHHQNIRASWAELKAAVRDLPLVEGKARCLKIFITRRMRIIG